MAIFLLIFFILLATYGWLIDYYRKSWNKIPDLAQEPLSFEPSISLIVPVRNEEQNLPALIASITRQNYPASRFEVLLIDDNSTDGTWEYLYNLPPGNVNLRAIRLADLVPNDSGIKAHKKLAIEKAIGNANGDLIVTTDADCVAGPQWLHSIARCYAATNAKFIAAPVKIQAGKSFLSLFQAIDFLTLQGVTGASVSQRFHTMCNGANLAYEKAAFYEVDGFSGIDTIHSGDDMLLMYKIYRQHPDGVFYLKNREAIVTTTAANSWREFFHQRIRWSSKATHYDDKKIFRILLLVYGVNFCFLLLGIASFWKLTWLFFFLLLVIAKVIVEFPFVNAVAIFFGETRLMKYFPLMQPFHIIYTIIAGWLGKFGSYEWKGRRIKQ